MYCEENVKAPMRETPNIVQYLQGLDDFGVENLSLKLTAFREGLQQLYSVRVELLQLSAHPSWRSHNERQGFHVTVYR